MNDCLLLPLHQGAGGGRPLMGWEGTWQALGEGEAEGLALGAGSAVWEPVAVPAQQAASWGHSSIWYRTRFARPDHTGRVLLRFRGAFLAANVWLNGRLLGSHYGYFGAFGFDVTPFLREENLLVVCCESPIETDLSRKRHVMGNFNDGDTRPYPASAFFSLPPEYRWEVPLGLWGAVELEYVGAVVMDWMRLRPRVEAGDTGRLEVELRLRNLDGRNMSGECLIEVSDPDRAQAPPLRLRREFHIAGGTEQTLTLHLSVPQARRWSPWRFGPAHLYEVSASVLVGGERSSEVLDRFGFRESLIHAGRDGWSVQVNGRRMFLRGANYAPQLRLDHLSEAGVRADLELARSAHLDALRIHAHALPEFVYRLADEAGMLVFADFPLTLAYAYHASAEESRFFETAVREQVPEFVSLLHNHPSVVLWTAHDDPPWIPANAALADVHAVRQNYSIDQEARALFQGLDASRAALAASGEIDSHLWNGWREGSWSDFSDLPRGMVSEFGAQALPSIESPAWDQMGRAWPVAGDDARWLYAGFQLASWAERGVGLPTDHDSLEEYIEAGQAYQAHLLAYAIDQMRKHKFEPCSGAFVYQLVDPTPGPGFGLFDSARVPRAALAAVREAMAPVRVIIDPIGFSPTAPHGFGFPPGVPVSLRLVVVNDDPEVGGEGVIRWSVWRESAPEQAGLMRLRDAVRRKSFSGSVAVLLPSWAEAALQASVINLPLEAEGEYRMEAELRLAGRSPIISSLAFQVLAEPPPERRTPLLPRYLAERLVVSGSLRPYADGVRFKLCNRTRPAVIAGMRALRLDGRNLTDPALLVEQESGRLPMPRRLELPLGRELDLLVELGGAPEPGEHELELEISVPGLASGRTLVGGAVAAEDFAPPTEGR